MLSSANRPTMVQTLPWAEGPNSTISRDHADHHLGVLMSPDGPFAWSEDSSQRDEPLPHAEPPPGLFPDMRDQNNAPATSSL